ncbi:BCCT family transporter [Clostridium sp. UBA6640]|uniref:BCCT family transporter n=1 Tax=Clostridium sp. UBA6640 TaxID=1946370 RepID=UPI0025BA4D08|nr:BCCT family transporter [Clostridium sp. UBA6640]
MRGTVDEMKEKDKQRSGSSLFWASASFTAIFSVWGVIDPEGLTTTLYSWTSAFNNNFNWFVILMPLLILALCAYLAFGKYGHIKLGGEDTKPEFSTFSWMSMLFTAGIGVGLVNFGVAEPLIHYMQSPMGLAGGFSETQAAQNALKLTLFDWGLPAWAIYTISGLVIGYFTYNRGGKFLPGTPIEEGFRDRKWGKPLAYAANLMGAAAAALTMAASVGLGVFQVRNGVQSVFGINLQGITPLIVILAILFAVYTLAAILPVQKGMKVLGDINVIIAIALLLYVFFVGRTGYFMGTILTTLKSTFTDIISISFENYALLDKTWFNDWPITILMWWVSWTPFIGIFIARISKGRTIKQIVTASILVPTIFLVLWFSVFGGYGLLDAIAGDAEIANYILQNPDDVYLSFIMVLQKFPLFGITGLLFVALIIVFLSTSATSSVISLSMMTSDGAEDAPKYRSIVWSIIIVLISSANLIAGSFNGVRAVAIVLSIPYLFLFILSMSGFMRQIRKDHGGVE